MGFIGFFIYCQDKQITEFNNVASSISNSQNNMKWESVEFTVPFSFPEELDSLVLAKADTYGCDGIRILKTDVGEETFLVSFFTDKDGIKKEEHYDHQHGFQPISSTESAIINNTLVSQNFLSKKGPANIQYTYCWPLAQFWINSGYSGTTFQFSQEAASNGFYHKVINNLGAFASCCADSFYGGLNDNISSHQWANEIIGDKRTSVDKIKVWKNTSRSGPFYTFTSTKAHHDNNYIDEEFCELVWTGSVWVPVCYTINDKVSSVDMTYYVIDN